MKCIALFLPNLEGGGAERAFVELANDFTARGYAVDLVLAHRHGPYVSEVSPAVHVVDLRTTRWPLALVRLARYLSRARPDVLMSGLDVANMVAIVASMMAGLVSRCVISQRAVVQAVWEIDRPRTWRFWLWLMRLTYPRARLVICNSSAAADEAVQLLGVPPGRCAVVLNPVDLDQVDRLARERVTDEWISPSGSPLILSVGSLTPRKNMTTLLEAFALLRRQQPARLIILGEGGERAMLEARVKALGVAADVRMPGFVQNPFPWIARADLFASTSLAEGCPNVIQQALACGTPVVATDCPGGTAEVLGHGQWGRLVPMRDSRALAEAMGSVLADDDRPDGRARALEFERQVIVDRYLELLLGRAAEIGNAGAPFEYSTSRSES